MADKKSARSNVAALEQAKAENSRRTFCNYSISILPENQGESWILPYLLHGRENATKAKDICQAAGISCTRFLGREIEIARRNGAVILSNSRGYFLPDRDHTKAIEEIESFCAALHQRSATTLAILQAPERVLRVLKEEQNE